MAKTYYAGMQLDAPCGRCKLETSHRILTITDGVPEKIICARCNSTHKFRPEHLEGSKGQTLKTRPAKEPKVSQRSSPSSPRHFQSLMATENPGSKAQPYGKGTAWETGMWMDHPSFGLGKIQHKAGRKVEVLFQEGLKTLLAL